MVWYSHLLKNFPQFVVIHTIKSFIVVNKSKADVFRDLSCFFYDPMDGGNLISCSSKSTGHLEVHCSHSVEALLGEF